jgi:hypothetical protein
MRVCVYSQTHFNAKSNGVLRFESDASLIQQMGLKAHSNDVEDELSVFPANSECAVFDRVEDDARDLLGARERDEYTRNNHLVGVDRLAKPSGT